MFRRNEVARSNLPIPDAPPRKSTSVQLANTSHSNQAPIACSAVELQLLRQGAFVCDLEKTVLELVSKFNIQRKDLITLHKQNMYLEHRLDALHKWGMDEKKRVASWDAP
jgi:hypothetical protein